MTTSWQSQNYCHLKRHLDEAERVQNTKYAIFQHNKHTCILPILKSLHCLFKEMHIIFQTEPIAFQPYYLQSMQTPNSLSWSSRSSGYLWQFHGRKQLSTAELFLLLALETQFLPANGFCKVWSGLQISTKTQPFLAFDWLHPEI